ncbi:Cytochrome c [Rubripirellula lacrimiformis]|uniref:Cytochrome c n=1 Tax=Rubripirellula lacrimiformis TaxID=1930273 RepID=A0A517NF09_9BACT|nr:PVC-type heme-binding CxxCH protein [Rubripirellula lacrimiformis]QDT05720.1 Cytochrome c [Rubripirellula lacrimiformis]
MDPLLPSGYLRIHRRLTSALGCLNVQCMDAWLRSSQGCIVCRAFNHLLFFGYLMLRRFVPRLFLASACLAMPTVAAEEADHVLEPHSVAALTREDSFSKIEVADPFQIEMVAAEPLVMDPVDFDWGPDGRLWVVEMADYPIGINGDGKPGGRVRVLEDRDGDGKYDHSTLFADNLSTPSGVLVWRNGILVTACPDVLYLEDTTGDGVADHVEKLYSGFTEGNQQHRVNGLRWGLDNWVYLANGDSGGTVVSNRTGKSVNISGRDLRIRPDTGEIETQSGQTQFGRNCDSWGNWFGCNNPNPVFHYVLDEGYLSRNPHVVPPSVRRDIRVGDTKVFPIGPIISHCDPIHRPIGATPIFTSACGTIVYRDTLFGADYHGATFTSEPVYNIVHARKLVPHGVTFESIKMHADGQEFLRSADPFSRPAGLHVGPDGALYVADMVREVIEHPQWIADDLEAQLDLRSGSDLGRIYRVAPRQSPRRPFTRFDQMGAAELVQLLDSPSGWQRDLVQRMLLWRWQDIAADARAKVERAKVERAKVERGLRRLMSDSPNPLARLHALATLAGLQVVSAADLQRSLADSHPGIRRHAIRILGDQIAADKSTLGDQEWSGNGGGADWQAAIEALVADDDPMVQLQLAYTLGSFDDRWAADCLASVAAKAGDDVYLRAAVLSSIHSGNVRPVLSALLDAGRPDPQWLGTLAGIAIKLNVPSAAAVMLSKLESDIDSPDPVAAWQVLTAWYASLGSSAGDLDRQLDPASIVLLDRFHQSVHDAVLSGSTSTADRLLGMRLLGRRESQRTGDVQLLASFLSPQTPVQLQQAAVSTVAALNVNGVPGILTAGWSSHGPALRQQVLSELTSRPAWTLELLEMIGQGTISANSLSGSLRRQLSEHGDAKIRDRAIGILGTIDADRDKVVQAYQPSIDELVGGSADVDRGRLVFTAKCSACHRLEGLGTAIGPDLTALTNRSPEALLTAIIDPSRAVEAKYQQYQVLLDDGRAYAGVLTEETATSLKLITADGKSHSLLRNEIERLQGNAVSMMPVGLEKEIDSQQMADLLLYVQHQSSAK